MLNQSHNKTFPRADGQWLCAVLVIKAISCTCVSQVNVPIKSITSRKLWEDPPHVLSQQPRRPTWQRSWIMDAVKANLSIHHLSNRFNNNSDMLQASVACHCYSIGPSNPPEVSSIDLGSLDS